jgi:hypothetical protein
MCRFGSKDSSILIQFISNFTVDSPFKLGGTKGKRSREEMPYKGNKMSVLGMKTPHLHTKDLCIIMRFIFSDIAWEL